MRTLRITAGPAEGQELELESELVVGRDGADLVIGDEEMSRRHVALRPVDNGVEVEDLGSTNGTYVDGRRIYEPVTISIRGAVKVGLSEIRVNVSLPQEQATRLGGVGQATHVSDVTAPGADVTAPRDVPQQPPRTDVTAPRQVPQQPPPADVTAPRQVVPAAPPAPAAPAAAPASSGGEESVYESPHLPIPASAAIFTAATVAIVVILLLFGG